jgi:hypothetical protein
MVDLLFDWFGFSCLTTDIFLFYFQNRLIQTGQTGGQQYSDASPFSIPCRKLSHWIKLYRFDKVPYYFIIWTCTIRLSAAVIVAIW